MTPTALDMELARAEAGVPTLRPGLQKRIVWAAAPGAPTDLALVYVHGFSASSEELRPLPDRLAKALGANLFYTRLAGHGCDSAAMGRATLAQWRQDLAEALQIGRRIGRRVVMIGSSTGASLVSLDAARADAVVLIAPNYRIKAPAARLLTWPLAPLWVPWITGKTRRVPPRSKTHEQAWTLTYPVSVLFPMAQAARQARRADVAQIHSPALFVFDPQDNVVDAAETRRIAQRWGGPSQIHAVSCGPGDDPARHVIAGDVLSPGMTDPLSDAILGWITTL